MNTSPYKGYAPRQTTAMRHDRAMRAALGPVAYAAMRAEREAYYRDLIKRVSK